ncbi:MAG: aminoacyl-tRNA hydrolase [Clostridiales bacterium]|nr:aminoacyl-tRNA hydrolase [Clostridiales bacterium]
MLKKEVNIVLFGRKSKPEWLLVFLGNPGLQYDNTRHNAGFRTADALAAKTGVQIKRSKFEALVGELTCGGVPVLAMKPQTFMNNSGNAVYAAANFYKIDPSHIIVVCDDVSLPVGKLRLRKKGSAGGHNGLKDIILQLGTQEFPRVRIGVGQKPHPDYDLADWVLGRFSKEDAAVMDEAAQRACQAIEAILEDGMDRAMSRFN